MVKKRKVKKLRLLIFLICLIIFGLGSAKLVTTSFNQVKTVIKEAAKPKEYNLSLVATGDCLIHGTVYRDAQVDNNKYDFKPMLSDIKPIIKEYDLAFYNQETIIGGKAMGLSSYPMFNSPEEIGLDMIDAGFNMVSNASNHTFDRGEKAVINSQAFWKEQKVVTAGSYDSFEARDNIQVHKKNGITYALLAYTTLTNGFKPPVGKEYLWNIYNDELAKNNIESVRDKIDVLIVSMHWGNEYQQEPSKDQQRIAEYLSSLGVDIIIGHHPHVLQPVTKINNTLVIYSLGNFISSQIGEARLVGALVDVNINKKVDQETTTIKISDPKAQLIYTYYNKQRKNIKVYPFNKINNNILSNYETVYQKYSKILNIETKK